MDCAFCREEENGYVNNTALYPCGVQVDAFPLFSRLGLDPSFGSHDDDDDGPLCAIIIVDSDTHLDEARSIVSPRLRFESSVVVPRPASSSRGIGILPLLCVCVYVYVRLLFLYSILSSESGLVHVEMR